MPRLVLEIAHAPFGHENAYAGLFIAMGWVSVGNEGVVVLRGDGVYAGKKGQQDPFKEINLPPTEKQVRDVLETGGRVVADRRSLQSRGIGEDMLIEGVEVLGEEIRRLIIEQGERVLAL